MHMIMTITADFTSTGCAPEEWGSVIVGEYGSRRLYYSSTVTCAEVSTLMAMVKTRIDPALRVKDASRYK